MVKTGQKKDNSTKIASHLVLKLELDEGDATIEASMERTLAELETENQDDGLERRFAQQAHFNKEITAQISNLRSSTTE